MGVVFDEVLTEVVTPPQQTEPPRASPEERQTPQAETLRWEQHQVRVRRRQRRLEAE
jgi:hypothetical protein